MTSTKTWTRTFLTPTPPRVIGPRPSKDLAEAVRARLHQCGYLALREIAIDTTGREVVLRGRVSSFYLKQVAQAQAGAVEGVRLVVNQIEVDKPSRNQGPHRPERPFPTLIDR